MTTASAADAVTDFLAKDNEMAKKYKNTVHKNTLKEGIAQKPFPWIPVTIVLLSITVVVLLSVCLARFFSPMLVSEMGGSRITDKRNDVTYTLAPSCYSADLDTTEVYAKMDGIEFYKLKYRSAEGELTHYDPLKIIGTVDEFGIISLYVASGETLPTLAEMEVDSALMYYVKLAEVYFGALSPESANETAALFADENRENALPPLSVDHDQTLMIYFGSLAKYPHIRYAVKYLEDYDGNRYIYDSTTGRRLLLTDTELPSLLGGEDIK